MRRCVVAQGVLLLRLVFSLGMLGVKLFGMEKTKNFSELIVWQKAHQFVLEVYTLTKGFQGKDFLG